MTDDEFATLHVRDLPGVFAARRLGRELAAGLALEQQDQVRVATALSEISRSTVTAGQTAVIVFGADNRQPGADCHGRRRAADGRDRRGRLA